MSGILHYLFINNCDHNIHFILLAYSLILNETELKPAQTRKPAQVWELF